ncbi:MAG: PDZ domain-containing protein, partial [Planctomycetota bacterium]
DTEMANSKPADHLPPDRFGYQGFLIQQGNVRTLISRDGYRLNQVSTQVKVQRDAQTQNRTFELLRNVGAIEKVEFSDRTIAPDELGSFFEVTGNLTQLTFANCDLKPLAESKVAWPNRIMTVEVKDSTLTADQTKPILAISGLSKLIFQNCEVAPGALDKFNESKNLVSMEFSSMEISSQLFQSLANLNRVTSLQLSGVKFDKDDYQKLLAARPELEVVFTARAFLGVRGPLNVGLDDPGCEISTVIPNSGAAEAGILEGDVIESVNGQRIIRFEDLRIQVAQHVPGDVLKIRVARGGKRLTLDVKLKDVSTAPQY